MKAETLLIAIAVSAIVVMLSALEFVRSAYRTIKRQEMLITDLIAANLELIEENEAAETKATLPVFRPLILIGRFHGQARPERN